MGMDVYGQNPTTKAGEYFRNTVWYWSPLWDYCCDVAPELVEFIEKNKNGGQGLDEYEAIMLAEILDREISTGRAEKHENAHNARIAALPRHDCTYCDATGIRTDGIGNSMGMPDRELDEVTAMVVGRTHGWCNACRGEGIVDDFDSSYPFDVNNVKQFAKFCRHSGGFKIY